MSLLDVIALHAADAERAEAGGADRIELLGTMDDDGLSPEPRLVEKVRRATPTASTMSSTVTSANPRSSTSWYAVRASSRSSAARFLARSPGVMTSTMSSVGGRGGTAGRPAGPR